MKHLLTVALLPLLIATSACGGKAGGDSEAGTRAMNFVTIPAGQFTMGSSEDDAKTNPAHEVTILREFALSATEVTCGQWEQVMGERPRGKQGLNHPATNVSWDACREFCEKLTARHRQDGTLPANLEYRLPTEAEWEYACRAGSSTPYWFGDPAAIAAVAESEGEAADTSSDEGEGEDSEASELELALDPYAWFEFNSDGKAQAVGEKEASAWGLHDMHGNVWEWCLDSFDPTFYTRSPGTDPLCAVGESKVIRGGSYDSSAAVLRADHRYDSAQHFAYPYVGFRVARVQVE